MASSSDVRLLQPHWELLAAWLPSPIISVGMLWVTCPRVLQTLLPCHRAFDIFSSVLIFPEFYLKRDVWQFSFPWLLRGPSGVTNWHNFNIVISQGVVRPREGEEVRTVVGAGRAHSICWMCRPSHGEHGCTQIMAISNNTYCRKQL